MGVFKINAKITSHYAIDLVVGADALAGATTINLTSSVPFPIQDGQGFNIKSGLVDVPVVVDGDQSIQTGSNNLIINPLPQDVFVGDDTPPLKDHFGNSVDQTIEIVYFASVGLSRAESRARQEMPPLGGSDKISLKYIGRIVKPKFYDAWLENGRNSMQLQSGQRVYQEGQFIADPTPASRLGTQRILGDKILGWFIIDSPARYIQGDIYESCC